jgi:hypothetical protein
LVTLHCLWCLTQLLSTALLHTIFELHSQRTVGAIACIYLVGRLEWTKFLSKSTFTTQILLEFRKITIFKSSCLSHTCLTIVTLAWTMMIAKVCLRGGSRQSSNFSASCDMGQIGTWACFHSKSLPFDFLCSILMLATSNSEGNKKTPKMFICKV